MISVVWFRRDLRIDDHPALCAGLENGTLLPIYILDETADHYSVGSACRWWLHHALHALNASLVERLGVRLRVFKGNSAVIIEQIMAHAPINAVFWNRCYDAARIKHDTHIKQSLKEKGVAVISSNGSLLWEPWDILKSDRTFYKVFTPYFRRGCLGSGHSVRAPLTLPHTHHPVLLDEPIPGEIPIDALNLMPTITWYEDIERTWDVSENAARMQLKTFLEYGLKGYKEGRNIPHKKHVSRLSPYLQSGLLSPHQIWHAACSYAALHHIPDEDLDCFLSELGWREFSYYLLYHFPQLPTHNFQSKFDQFPWNNNDSHLIAWQRGLTGYPLVDAGMRELWKTGYMHNRVRMVVASFLVKNLRIDWRLGERWFWDCLVDADVASNSASWQWVAGSGADAAPYFRVFNPTLQAEKFDPEGHYMRTYIPELSRLPNKYLACPWKAPASMLNAAGVVLGKTYPYPIVDQEKSRDAALAAYQHIR